MEKEILDPLEEYIKVFRDNFKNIAEETINNLAREASVDVEANRETCSLICVEEEKLFSIKECIGWWKALYIFLLVSAAAGFITLLEGTYRQCDLFVYIVGGVCMVGGLLLLKLLVNPKLDALSNGKDELGEKIDGLKKEAWGQMEPMNLLYDWDMFNVIMGKAVPQINLDPYFTTQRMNDLRTTYGWHGYAIDDNSSIVYCQSGTINGNPFLIYREKSMWMGSKTYNGQKYITWTTEELGVDGEYQTVNHSEILRATVDAPYPYYDENTHLIYGNTAAPDLTFNRKRSGLAGRNDSISFKRKKRSLHNKSRNLSKHDFAMMTNEEFEAVFDTSNRNNNQQFALLFTPLAQENMIKLLSDYEAGYGDDFDFNKGKMINTINSKHLQEFNVNMDPSQYKNFDYDKAKEHFLNVNMQHFREIYFGLAPLLCVPMYQQVRSDKDIHGTDTQDTSSSFWEHESLANFYGEEKFSAFDCVTDSILKTEQVPCADTSMVKVHAHGYKKEKRVTYVEKMGGDGELHQIPVEWYEYLPVTGEGVIFMKEGNLDGYNDATTQTQRMNYINNMLEKEDMTLYRRHIASKCC